jgi:ectoine hydroxylase-related dioxygenase (phytanoyl-CoA dioxygenase family)
VVQLLQQLHPKVPGGELVYTPHQDASNRRFGTDLWRNPGPGGAFVQMVVALDPATPQTGGLMVWPGSHRAGFVSHPETGVVPPEWRLPEHAKALTLAPGDLLVFGPFLVHGSPPNPSPRARTLFIQGYTLPGVNHRAYAGSGLGVLRGR